MNHVTLLDIVIIFVYLIGMLFIGFHFTKRVKTAGDFYVAGRTLGPVVLAATVCASIIGGTPLLGISKTVVKAHGSSDVYAFKNAIRQARDSAQSDVIESIVQNIDLMRLEPPIAKQ